MPSKDKEKQISNVIVINPFEVPEGKMETSPHYPGLYGVVG